jgi:predicted nucleic acid-binding protein
MTPPRNQTRVFFDASVIFSAIYSATGASSKLASWSALGKLIGLTSQTVVEEVIANTDKFKSKIQPADINQFILKHGFLIRNAITLSETKPYAAIVHPKDAHVLAGANLTQSDYLVTLDKKHLNQPSVKSKFAHISALKILSPHQLVSLLS